MVIAFIFSVIFIGLIIWFIRTLLSQADYLRDLENYWGTKE